MPIALAEWRRCRTVVIDLIITDPPFAINFKAKRG
jgi:hypothetical protein